MSRVIQIIPGEWESIMTNVLSSRDNFDKEMFEITKGAIADTVVYFPPGLNIDERYKIHTYSKSGLLTSYSTGKGDNRYLICNMTKDYIQILYNNYNKLPEIVESPEQIFKKKVFTDILQILKDSFGKEFEDYLKTI